MNNGNQYNNDTSGKKGGDNYNQNRPKNRVFTPVTIKMISEAPITPEDICEIDGQGI